MNKVINIINNNNLIIVKMNNNFINLFITKYLINNLLKNI